MSRNVLYLVTVQAATLTILRRLVKFGAVSPPSEDCDRVTGQGDSRIACKKVNRGVKDGNGTSTVLSPPGVINVA